MSEADAAAATRPEASEAPPPRAPDARPAEEATQQPASAGKKPLRSGTEMFNTARRRSALAAQSETTLAEPRGPTTPEKRPPVPDEPEMGASNGAPPPYPSALPDLAAERPTESLLARPSHAKSHGSASSSSLAGAPRSPARSPEASRRAPTLQGSPESGPTPSPLPPSSATFTQLRRAAGAAAIMSRMAGAESKMPVALKRLASSRQELVSIKKHSEPLSKAATEACGWRGIILLGMLTGAVLVFGAFSVWYFTGVKTSGLVLCLVQLAQQELSAHVGQLVFQLVEQASSIANVSLASATLLPMANGNLGSVLQHTSAAAVQLGAGLESPFAVFVASLAAAYPGHQVHFATDEGFYVGARYNASGAVLVRSRTPFGCLLQTEVNPATATPAGSTTTLDCSWAPSKQPWFSASNCSTPSASGYCWSPPFRVQHGAAVALSYRLDPTTIEILTTASSGGVLAVEIAFAPLEAYMRSFVRRLPAERTELVLVDQNGLAIASTTAMQREQYAAEVMGVAAWGDAIVALDRAAHGLPNPSCYASITESTSSVDGSYCSSLNLGKPLCEQVGPIGVQGGGDCILASQCGLDAIANRTVAGVQVPTGWTLRSQAPQSSYYPKLTTTTYATLVLSVVTSVIVAIMLTRVVWLLDRSNDDVKKNKGKVRICGLRIRASVAHTILLLIGGANYAVVFLTWYFMFRDASHDMRDGVFQVLDEATVRHATDVLEVLPRAAQLLAAWQPLWSNVTDAGAGAFALFASHLMLALSGTRGSPKVVPAGPPASRLVVDEPLMEILYVPANASVSGVRQLPLRSGELCMGEGCFPDPRTLPWWTATSSPMWSEVHLLGDQLAVTYTMPLNSSESATTEGAGWIACSIPVHVLRKAFTSVGSSSVSSAGFIVQLSSSPSTGSHQGALIASQSGDEERRLEVGGEWATARREPSQSHDKRNRDAASSVNLFLHTSTLPQPALIGLPRAETELSSSYTKLKEKRVYRTFGAPRTFVTPIRGAGCDNQTAASGGCGLDWATVVLVDWMDFFAEWYKERDLSLMIFAILLALQLHIVQVAIHSSIRHVEGAKGKKKAVNDMNDPSHETATEELAQPSSRWSRVSAQSASSVEDSNTTFERYRQIISVEVRRAQGVAWHRFLVLQWLQKKVAALLAYLPLDRFPELKRTQRELSKPWRSEERDDEKRYRRAIRYVRMAQEHRNILTVCALRQGQRFAALQLYLLQSTWLYGAFMHAIVFAHVLLVAAEPTPGDFMEGRASDQCPVTAEVTMASLACLFLEIVDVLCCRWVARNERAVAAESGRRRRQSFHAGGRFDGDNMLQSRGEATRREVRSLLLLGIVLEHFCIFVLCWRPFGMYVPLRPLFLLLSSSTLSATCASILYTLGTRGMRSVAVCFLTLWVLAAMYATTLLRSQGNGIAQADGTPSSCPSAAALDAADGLSTAASTAAGTTAAGTTALGGEEGSYEPTLLNTFSFTPVSFQTFTLSFISTFILISTGENYADVVSRPFFCYDLLNDVDASPPPKAGFLIVCWIGLSLVGLVLLIGMFIGVFQDGFVRQRRAQQTQMKLFERVGAIAAFSLLDVEDDGHVTSSEFVAFVKYLESNEEMAFVMTPEELFKLLQETGGGGEGDETGGETRMNLSSFVFNLWFLQLKGVLSVSVESEAAMNRLPKLRALYDHPSLVIQKIIKFLLLVHALFATLYGFLLEESSYVMDTALAILVILEAAEVALKLVVYGPSRFWNAGQFEVGKTFEQWENRTALIISGSAFVAWLVTRPLPAAEGLGFGYEHDLHRVILVGPTMRLFFTLKQARRVPFVLIPLRSYLGSVFMLMVLNSLMFAGMGVMFFEGELPDIRDAVAVEQVRVASFESVGSAMLCLVQILIGEGWHEIMFAVMNAKHSWYGAIYFIIFVFIQTILLTNLLVGVVLDSTSGFSIDEELSLQRTVLYGDKLKELEELIALGAGREGRGDFEESLFFNSAELLRRTSDPAAHLGGSNNNTTEASLGHSANQRRRQESSLAALPNASHGAFKPQLLPVLSRACVRPNGGGAGSEANAELYSDHL